MRSLPQRLLLVGLCALAPSVRAERRPVLTVVVIDPGHGGSNLGAPACVDGVYEKQLTLAVARALRRRLERDGIQVVATRERDVYLTLAERVRRANTARPDSTPADLFLSLHANATAAHDRTGVESYVLARPVRDIEARRAGAAAADPAVAPEAMLARARVQQVGRESVRLAQAVQSRLAEARCLSCARTAGTGDRGVHQAPFDVLEGLAMPAALVEVGFIDHPTEGLELLQPETIRRIADAIADGIADFAAGAQPALANSEPPRAAPPVAARPSPPRPETRRTVDLDTRRF